MIWLGLSWQLSNVACGKLIHFFPPVKCPGYSVEAQATKQHCLLQLGLTGAALIILVSTVPHTTIKKARVLYEGVSYLAICTLVWDLIFFLLNYFIKLSRWSSPGDHFVFLCAGIRRTSQLFDQHTTLWRCHQLVFSVQYLLEWADFSKAACAVTNRWNFNHWLMIQMK